MATTDADRVRQYSARTYVEPARTRGETTVRIVAGEVQKAVHLSNRVPLVCQALKSHKFLDENGLSLEKWDGPPSGMSTTVVFTYRFRNPGAKGPGEKAEWPFLRLRGIAKEVFSDLGGGEEFIRKEREQFYASPGRPSGGKRRKA